MKRPFEEIIDIYSENLERIRENQLRNFENSERFMLWVVGFAIGGLSLVISNLSSFHNHYNYIIIKIVLVSLAISVISGIVYRWAFYSLQIQYQQIEFYLKGAFSNRRMMQTDRQDVSKETDFKRLAFIMNYDFGVDLTHKIEEYDNAEDPNIREFLLEDLKNYYRDMNELAIEEYNSTMIYVNGIYQKAFGLTNEQIERINITDIAKLLKLYGKITIGGFIISCLTFAFVIVLLTVLY